jgi:hypothetical protein
VCVAADAKTGDLLPNALFFGEGQSRRSQGKILPPKQLDRSESRYPVAFTARAFRTVFGVPDRPLQQ